MGEFSLCYKVSFIYVYIPLRSIYSVVDECMTMERKIVYIKHQVVVYPRSAMTELHDLLTLEVRATVKTELSYRNDKINGDNNLFLRSKQKQRQCLSYLLMSRFLGLI